jgi:hypothetical protein
MRSIYFAGLDLGQRQDPTALAVVEWTEYAGAWDAAAFEHRQATVFAIVKDMLADGEHPVQGRVRR